MRPATLVDAIRRHAAGAPTRTAVRLLRHTGAEPTTDELSYAELDLRARRFAVWVREHARPGDRVLLAHPDGAGQVVSFIGCLYAGVVPLNPAIPARGQQQEDRVAGVIRDAGVSLVLTDADRHQPTADLLGRLGFPAPPCAVPAPDDAAAQAWQPPRIGPDSLAFLQYTSGSTGDPKGVMISHGALAHNARAIVKLTGGRPGEAACGWLPLHHDMGLVGLFLAPLYGGGITVLMPPADFIRHPVRWLRLIHRYRAGYTAAPNFALDLCVKRVTPEQAAALDLSGLRVILNGAEPIDRATVDRFVDHFAVSGLDPKAVKPGYGLAESTLLVTATPLGEGYRGLAVDAEALRRHELRPLPDVAEPPTGAATSTGAPRAAELISSGRPQGARVRVVDPDTRAELGDGQVGEVWVSGASLASGYWNRPDLTRDTFGAHLADGAGPYLRTGDLGAWWRGELYLTGRVKEVIVMRGRNIYPHDAERALGGLHTAFQGVSGCVFSIVAGATGGGEEPVVLQEVRPSAADGPGLPALARLIRESLTESLGVPVTNVVLVPPGTVRRTTSGKVQRLTMRELFLTGRLRVIHEELTPAVRGVAAAGRS